MKPAASAASSTGPPAAGGSAQAGRSGARAPARAVLDQRRPGTQLHDPVDQRQPRAGVVVDDDQWWRCRSAVAAGDGRAHQRRAGRVELGGGLVEQQQPRAPGQHAGEHQPLLLARRRAPAVGRSRPYGKPTAASASSTRGQISSGGQAGVLQAERDVVPGPGHDQLAVRVLGEQAQPAPGGARRAAVHGELAGDLGALGVQDAGQRARAAWTCPRPEAPVSSTRSPGSTTRSTPVSAQARREGCRTPSPRATTRAGVPPDARALRRQGAEHERPEDQGGHRGAGSDAGAAGGERAQRAGAGQRADQQQAADAGEQHAGDHGEQRCRSA